MGEGVPLGRGLFARTWPSVRAGLEIFAPVMLGEAASALEHINRLMDVTLPGHLYVKSALDVVCWDLLGRTAGMPLWRLMGAQKAAPVADNSSISTGTPEEMTALMQKASTKGYRVHSAMINGSDTSADIERIEAISAALPAGEKVIFDVNRVWTPARL